MIEFLTRVRLRNYRSIESCDLKLDRLTFLVGANGSGKSNFLDALRLVSDSLQSSLDHALRERGGVQEVRRRSAGHPTHFGIRLDFNLQGGADGHYGFTVGARTGGDFVVKKEVCRIGQHTFEVEEGVVKPHNGEVLPPAVSDRLYLVNAAGLPQFRPLFDSLSRMGFYNVNPERIRALQPPDKGELLRRDGGNLASVVARMDPKVKERVTDYLTRVVPGIVGFDHKRVGHMETLELRQHVQGASDAWRFPAINMSDGTLRALAILVALFQAGHDPQVPLIGMEEPETALHPAASGVLRDCILEASRSVQVIVTSHSADLLDDPDLPAETIRAVESTGGRTEIGTLDDASRSALKDRLYTAGELLRVGQLAPDRTAFSRGTQLRLFEEDGP